MEFHYFHKYNKLVRRGIAEPIKCGVCASKVYLLMGEDDEPEFYCFFCDTQTQPGQNTYDKVRKIVDEAFNKE